MNRILRFGSAASCAAALLTGGPAAHAQGSGSAAAEELFKEGRAALEAKDYPTACTKLAESNRLERAVGTLISLAQCEEAQNKLASSRQHWQEAADLADALQDRLQRGAGARLKVVELDRRVSRLTVTRAPDAPPSTSVKRDDVTLLPASFGSALPLDPGTHVIIASADAHEPKQFEVTLAEGESKTIEVEPGAEIVAPPPPAGGTASAPTDKADSGDTGSTWRTVGYVTGATGLVAIGIGVVFGLKASGSKSDAKCDSNNACDPAALSDARSSATVSTIAVIAGSALLAGGIAIVLVASSSKNARVARLEASPHAGQGSPGLLLRGTW